MKFLHSYCCPQTLQQTKLQFNPDVVIVSATADGALRDACCQPLEGCGREGSFSLRLERSAAFRPERALQMLGLLHVRCLPAHSLQDAKRHMQLLRTRVDLSRPAQLAALGGLLAALQRDGALHQAWRDARGNDAASEDANDQDGPTGAMEVDRMGEINLAGCVEGWRGGLGCSCGWRATLFKCEHLPMPPGQRVSTPPASQSQTSLS